VRPVCSGGGVLHGGEERRRLLGPALSEQRLGEDAPGPDPAASIDGGKGKPLGEGVVEEGLARQPGRLGEELGLGDRAAVHPPDGQPQRVAGAAGPGARQRVGKLAADGPLA
jgi:hypothetical protein